MCGIVGFMNLRQGAHGLALPVLKDMAASVRNRGPDESGLYIDDDAGLGHCRLSIVGLSGGGQPIHDEDSALWIVFNGEIYNYVELRKELEARGHRFYTATDTEVILHRFQERGDRCVEDFNGQFAFAIWDSRKKELFLARDRVGVRPLHYTVHEGAFIFGSEVKSIFMKRSVPRELDPVALDQVFTFWTTLPGRTLFKDIHELQAGHTMRVTKKGIETRRFWSIPLYPPEAHVEKPPSEIAGEVAGLLLDSVKIRLRADVVVGSYISGGLDSSGITALVVRNFNSHVRTFGVTFEEKRFDESAYQRRMVDFLAIDHAEIAATNAKIREWFPQVIWHAEKPLLRTGPVPLFLLSQLVSDSGVKVVLTGEGADEFFGGYNIFREALVRRFWARNPASALRSRAVTELYPNIFESRLAKNAMKSFFGMGLADVDSPLFSHLLRWSTTSRIKAFFADDFRKTLAGYSGLDEVAAMLPPDFARLDCLAKAQYLEIMIFLSNYLLSSQGDRVAMGHSIEIRFPYLDHRLLEYLGHVPSRWKILGLSEKHILKRVFRGLLPPEIIARPKQPYRAPIQASLFGHAHDQLAETYLTAERLKSAGLFDPGKVAMLLAKLNSGAAESETEGMALAGILSTQIFHRSFIEDFNPALPPCTFTVVEDRRTNG